tara:strand:- start:491 stop:787 length:297 start_codon:yes stop_codon:yes gene_type:complete
MKLAKSQLRQIIEEELKFVLNEVDGDVPDLTQFAKLEPEPESTEDLPFEEPSTEGAEELADILAAIESLNHTERQKLYKLLNVSDPSLVVGGSATEEY